MTKTNKCITCKLELPRRNFSPKKFGSGNWGKHSECKDCAIKRMNDWKKKNRERFLAYQKKYSKSRNKINKTKI